MRIIFAFLICFGAAPVHAQMDVRVRLFDLDDPTAVSIHAVGGPVLLYAGEFENEIARLEAGQEATVRRASNQLHVSIGGGALYASSIRVEPTVDAQFGARVIEGAAPSKMRPYDGRLFVTVDEDDWEVKLINAVDLEDYIAAVIATEYGFDDLEGAKAMAVIIRTYTLASVRKFGSEYDHVDHTLSQVYRGTSSVTPSMRAAAHDTRGEILTHDGRLIEAVYFSASGGHTADNEQVWLSEALPYLRGKPDPYGKGSPHEKWTSRVPSSQLLTALRTTFGVPVSGFVVSGRSRDGRVTQIDLLREDGGRKTVRANEFRMLILKHFGARSLRSTLFDAKRDGDDYLFEGRGYGHGVGLSQWGAHDLALRGTGYKDILQFYYTDVKLETTGGLETASGIPEPVAAETPEKSRSRIGW